MMLAKVERQPEQHRQLEGDHASKQQRHERHQNVADPAQGQKQRDRDETERERAGLKKGVHDGLGRFLNEDRRSRRIRCDLEHRRREAPHRRIVVLVALRPAPRLRARPSPATQSRRRSSGSSARDTRSGLRLALIWSSRSFRPLSSVLSMSARRPPSVPANALSDFSMATPEVPTPFLSAARKVSAARSSAARVSASLGGVMISSGSRVGSSRAPASCDDR